MVYSVQYLESGLEGYNTVSNAPRSQVHGAWYDVLGHGTRYCTFTKSLVVSGPGTYRKTF